MGNTWYKYRITNIVNPKIKAILDMRQKIENQSVSEKEISDIIEDFITHLNTPCGTLDNYVGKYGKAIIEAIKKHYPDKLNDDYINAFISEKVKKLYDHIYQNTINDKRISIRSDMLKMITKYITGEKDQEHNFVFSVPFQEAINGIKTQPDPRA